MDHLLGFTVILLLLWAALLAMRLRFSFLHMIAFFLSVQAVAVLVNSLEKGNYFPAYAMLMGIAVFIAGVASYRFLVRGKAEPLRDHPRRSFHPNHDAVIICLFFAVIYLFVTYHYGVGGIPLFSPDVETERFEGARSGLMGIPSRITSFGTLFLIFLVNAYSQIIANRRRIVRRLLPVLYALTAVVLLFTGFKSSLIVLLEVMIIANAYVPSWRSSEKIPFRKIVIYLGLAMSVVFLIAGIYAHNKGVTVDLVEKVFRRVFYISGWPFYFIVDEFVPKHGPGGLSYAVLDLKYLFGLVHLGPALPYNSVQLVSSEMHGKDVFELFNVPITMNIFGQLYLEFKIAGILLGGYMVGFLCCWLYFLTFRTETVLGRSLFFYAQISVFSMATKGNIVYDMGNRSFAIMFLLVLLWGVAYIIQAPIRTRHAGAVKNFFFGSVR